MVETKVSEIRKQIQNLSLSGKNTWEIAVEAFNLGVRLSAENAEAIHAYPWLNNEPEVNKISILKFLI